jgi:hypothetical protein
MRTVTLLVLALTAACAAAPAWAQVRILTVQDQTQPQAPPVQPAAPEQVAPTQAAPPQASPAPATPAAPPEAKPPAPPAQAQAPASPSPKAETAIKNEDQRASETESQSKTPNGSQKARQAKAQDRVPPRPSARYGFSRVDDGFLRLDRKSGKVSYCTAHTQGWSCESVPENRASLEKQIDTLRDQVTAAQSEVAALKREIAELRKPPTPPHPVPPQTVPPSPKAGDSTGSVTLRLPSHEDLVRARGFLAATWHQLVEMIEAMQKDLLQHKGERTGGVSRT